MADVVGGMAVEVGVSFLKQSCAIQEIWITGREGCWRYRFSHDSHRCAEKGCEKVGTDVAKVSKCAVRVGLRRTGDSQISWFHRFHMGGICGGYRGCLEGC